MTRARDLISDRVVVAAPEQRLKDVGDAIAASNALYCAVVSSENRFVGLIRLSELVLKSAERICADLVSPLRPIHISDGMEADLVIKLLQAQGSDELVVISSGKTYVGLVTRESVFAWWSRQKPR